MVEAGEYCSRWQDTTPARIARMFTYTQWARCNLYGESLVTSEAYGRQQTRDNRWVAFQHHVHPCVSPHLKQACLPGTSRKVFSCVQDTARNSDVRGTGGLLRQVQAGER